MESLRKIQNQSIKALQLRGVLSHYRVELLQEIGNSLQLFAKMKILTQEVLLSDRALVSPAVKRRVSAIK